MNNPKEFSFLSAHTNRGGKMTTFSALETSETRFCIAFDWVSFSAKINEGFPLQNDNFLFSIERIESKSDFWEISSCVSGEWEKCARVASLSGYNQAGIVSVTLVNKYCYQSNLSEFIKRMCDEVGITWKNFTRLDVCGDFQKTDYRTLTAQSFLEGIVTQKYILKGKKYSVHSGSDEDFQHNFNAVSSTKKVETITWGKRKSGMSISMYNKTVELKRKNDKPYIRERWDAASFNPDFDTFRLEFSAPRTPAPLCEVDTDGTIIRCFDFTDISIIDIPIQYFKACYQRHFQVAIKKKGERFDRMKTVNLFDIEKINFVIPVRLSEKSSSNNYLKNKLKTTVLDIANLENTNEVLAENLHTYIEYNLLKHDLHRWFNMRFPDFKIKPNRYDLHQDYLNNRFIKGLVIQQQQLFKQ
jgi:hypothetical protein